MITTMIILLWKKSLIIISSTLISSFNFCVPPSHIRAFAASSTQSSVITPSLTFVTIDIRCRIMKTAAHALFSGLLSSKGRGIWPWTEMGAENIQHVSRNKKSSAWRPPPSFSLPQEEKDRENCQWVTGVLCLCSSYFMTMLTVWLLLSSPPVSSLVVFNQWTPGCVGDAARTLHTLSSTTEATPGNELHLIPLAMNSISSPHQEKKKKSCSLSFCFWKTSSL